MEFVTKDCWILQLPSHSTFQTFDDIELYPSVINKAVRLGFGLITNHPFIDGNKRIGTHAILVLLAINGIELQYNDEELISLILKIAAGQADDRALQNIQ